MASEVQLIVESTRQASLEIGVQGPDGPPGPDGSSLFLRHRFMVTIADFSATENPFVGVYDTGWSLPARSGVLAYAMNVTQAFPVGNSGNQVDITASTVNEGVNVFSVSESQSASIEPTVYASSTGPVNNDPVRITLTTGGDQTFADLHSGAFDATIFYLDPSQIF